MKIKNAQCHCAVGSTLGFWGLYFVSVVDEWVNQIYQQYCWFILVYQSLGISLLSINILTLRVVWLVKFIFTSCLILLNDVCRTTVSAWFGSGRSWPAGALLAIRPTVTEIAESKNHLKALKSSHLVTDHMTYLPSINPGILISPWLGLVFKEGSRFNQEW